VVSVSELFESFTELYICVIARRVMSSAVRGLGETVEKQMVGNKQMNRYLLRNGSSQTLV
jgi:hypothetical protein